MTIQLKIWQCRRHIQQRRDILGRDSQHDREADCPFCTIEILQTELLGKSIAEPSAEESEQFLKEYGSYANSLGVNTIAAYRLKVWLEARASLPAEQSAEALSTECAIKILAIDGVPKNYQAHKDEIKQIIIEAIAKRKED